MSIGNNLKRIIQEKGTNVNEVASKADIAPQTLYAMIRRNGSKIDIDILEKLALALGVFPGDILPFKQRYNIPSTDSFEYTFGELNDVVSIEIIENIDKLNDLGKKEAAKRIEELTQIPKYKK